MFISEQGDSKGENHNMHMIEASLEFGLHFGHSNFNFLDGVESTHEVLCSIPAYLKHLLKGVSPTKFWTLAIWPFDKESTTLWSPMLIKVKCPQIWAS